MTDLPRRQARKRRKGPVEYTGPRKAKPPFPISLILNVKAFYLFFIVVMIASLAAVGLGAGLSGGGGSSAPVTDEETPEASATPSVQTFPQGPALTIDATEPHKAIIKTNRGEIEIQLFTDAPQAVNSFAFLAGKGFYDGTAFFYVQKGFAAQAGDPTCNVGGRTTCTGVGSPGYTLPLEQTQEGHEQWAVVAPATVEGQSVHGSQFRILFTPDPRLDGLETVFGKVVAGQEILEATSDLVPCFGAQGEGCVATPDMASALVIEEVIVQQA